VIHLAVPVVLVALLLGAGVYGMLARRHAVLVLIGAELVLNAAGLLLVTASSLPAGGLARLSNQAAASSATVGVVETDPLLTGQVTAIFVVALAAAEIGLALAVILLLFRRTGSSDLTADPTAEPELQVAP
jgi:NADH-quinone oxidoreductase subunit K